MTPTIPYATACRGRTALVAALAGLMAVIAGCSRPQQASELPHTPTHKVNKQALKADPTLRARAVDLASR